MARVFLDDNVLFSAAYRPNSRLSGIWSVPNVELVTSLYAVEEARRNLQARYPASLATLNKLLSSVRVVPEPTMSELPDGIELVDKDVPVLLAAIGSGCTHLLTGDARHFGDLYGKHISGVLVQTPAQFLNWRHH